MLTEVEILEKSLELIINGEEVYICAAIRKFDLECDVVKLIQEV